MVTLRTGSGANRGDRGHFEMLPPPCLIISFLALPARCISKAWVCDGDSDCEDNSDEENCESLVCKPPSHTCANNTSICLPPEKLCDGSDDCGDGSDEGELCGELGPGCGGFPSWEWGQGPDKRVLSPQTSAP